MISCNSINSRTAHVKVPISTLLKFVINPLIKYKIERILSYCLIKLNPISMKAIKFLAFLAFTLTISFNVFSQDKTGQVYLIRSTGYTGSAINYRLYIDGQLVCKLKNKSFSIHDITAGEHTVSVASGGISNGKKSTPLKVTVAEGKTNYISIVSTQSGYVNKLTCQEITKNSADPLLAKTTQNNNCLPASEK